MPQETVSKESALFSMLAQIHIECGGAVGFKDTKWMPEDPPGSYLRLNGENRVEASWCNAVNAVVDVGLRINRERGSYNDVYFFFPNNQGSNEGVTWRMLKIDMSFLRIVLDRDSLTMKEIIRRFVRISEKTQVEGADEFENLN